MGKAERKIEVGGNGVEGEKELMSGDADDKRSLDSDG